MAARAVAVVLAFAGVALIALGLWAVTEAALGHNGGTDTSPQFGYVVGAPEIIVGIALVFLGVRATRG